MADFPPFHPFDPGYTGMSVTCNALVDRDGFGVDCAEPREALIHNAANGFQPISVSGTILLEGEDGRTCEIEIHRILLDRAHPDRWRLDVEHSPVYQGDGIIQKCVANPISALGVKIKVDSYTNEEMFTATFKPREA